MYVIRLVLYTFRIYTFSFCVIRLVVIRIEFIRSEVIRSVSISVEFIRLVSESLFILVQSGRLS